MLRVAGMIEFGLCGLVGGFRVFSCCVWMCLISGWLTDSMVAWVACCCGLCGLCLLLGLCCRVGCGLILVRGFAVVGFLLGGC